jgi:hypothetical protein
MVDRNSAESGRAIMSNAFHVVTGCSLGAVYRFMIAHQLINWKMGSTMGSTIIAIVDSSSHWDFPRSTFRMPHYCP